MGDMMGHCTASCDENDGPDCPIANLYGVQGSRLALPNGHCNCYRSHATSAGFWPVAGCNGDAQPLPTIWEERNEACSEQVMDAWRRTAHTVVSKGYKYLSTPLIAANMTYAEKFIEKACGCSGRNCSCTEASCGCP